MLSSLPLSIALLRLYCFILAFYSYNILIRYLLSLPVHIMHFYCFLIAFVISLSPLCSPTSSSLSRHARHSDPFLYHTACQEHSYLTCTPSPFFLLFTRPRTLHCRSPFLLVFLLLAGDIELNPGPTNFTVCTLNIRSLLHPLHSAAISDFIDSHNPDIFCLTETWIKPTTTFTKLADCTPPNYTLFSFPRTSKSTSSTLSVVALNFLSVSPSHNYPPLSLNSPPSNHLLSLSNSLIPKYHYLISIALPHLPHSRNFFLFFMNLILLSLSLLPHLMNSSSLVTLTSTLKSF